MARLTRTVGGYYYHLSWSAFDVSGRNSMVECQLPKLEVVGSSPIARSRFPYTNQAVGDHRKHIQ